MLSSTQFSTAFIALTLLAPSFANAADQDSEARKGSIKASNPIAYATKIIANEMYVPGQNGAPDFNEFQLNVVAPLPISEKVNLINKVKLPWDTRPDGQSGSETSLGKVNYQAYFSQSTPFTLDNDLEVSFGVGPSINFNTSDFDVEMFGDDSTQAGIAGVMFAKQGGFSAIAGYQKLWAVSGDDLDTQSIQLVAGYTWNNGFSVNMAPYLTQSGDEDWYIPVGLGVGQFFKLGGKVPMKVIANGYYNAKVPGSMGDDHEFQAQLAVIMMAPSIFGIPLGG